jgi:dipeptidyl aminopeptidase/acylaminoacyl peptidase
MHRRTFFSLAAILLLPFAVFAQAKRPLDHDAYDIWKNIENESLSHDGLWVLYSLELQDGDAETKVHGLGTDVVYSIPRARSAQFLADSRFVVSLVAPERAAVKEAKRQKESSGEQPKDSLALVDLTTGGFFRVEQVKSFAVPEKAGGWLAYLLETEVEEEEEPEEEAGEGQEEPEQEEKDAGSTLVVRDLSDGTERRFDHVTEYAFGSDGRYLAYATSSSSGDADGVFAVSLGGGAVTDVLTGEGHYKSLVFDSEGRQLAFLSDKDDYSADEPGFALYHWRAGSEAAMRAAAEGSDGIPSGWWVSDNGQLRFSENGSRLFFGTAPRPAPEVEDSTLAEDRVDVEIWHWEDPLLQPMQQVRLSQERNRTYRAVVHLRDNAIAQLATEAVPEVALVREGDGDFVLGTSDIPYRQLISWDSPSYQDVYLIDVEAGQSERVLQKLQGNARVSPDGKYVFWWDNVEFAWFARNVSEGRVVNMTEGIPYAIYNEDHDWPYQPNSYGNAGWTDGDEEFLAYDRYDIWAVDPDGDNPPRNLTDGVGRRDSLRFRYVRLDDDEHSISENENLLLATFNVRTKAAGFYRDRVRGSAPPSELVFMDRRFSNPSKAKDADVLMFTRQSIQEYPDLWVSDPDFENMRKLSEANPQQSAYLWADVELIEWSSIDGVPLQGLLYTPENFDPSSKYPLMVTFYEKDSHNLHAHHPPVPHRSVVRPTFYASRGYVVFVPDIKYQVGYPGESAMDCVIPGVLELIEKGFVDEAGIGVQGHSWGGYQITYMVTKTDLFAAAAGGAPVSNMISAYGGIRWGSGMSRMFQYEKTQSRIGATLWESPLRYIENSPIFWADKVETPLMMMHNDHDHAVPWYQGIEMFVALRRLGKPAWLVNYVDELHWPQDYHERRDWNIRMQQFFDHYLRGAPAPVWLAEGIPAAEKGKTLGLETAAQAEPPDGV